jgi:hypothetical protein
MAGIAISYRREDTGWITGRIFDRLKAHYEKPGTSGFTYPKELAPLFGKVILKMTCEFVFSSVTPQGG